MSDKTIKDLTKKGNWQFTGEKPTNEHLIMSCLMRIADATEAMAKNYVQLQKDVEFWKQEYYHERNRREAYQRSSISYKAHFTRLKNKLSAQNIDEEK